MGRFVAKRVLAMPLLLLGIVSIAFAISRLIPSDPLVSIVGERALGNILNERDGRIGELQ